MFLMHRTNNSRRRFEEVSDYYTTIDHNRRQLFNSVAWSNEQIICQSWGEKLPNFNGLNNQTRPKFTKLKVSVSRSDWSDL